MLERVLLRRDTATGAESEVRVALGLPYDRKVEGDADRHESAGCIVVIDGEEMEHTGVDKLQAIAVALQFIDLHLAGCGTGGVLHWPDGRRYESKLDALFAGLVQDVMKKMLDAPS